MVRWFCWIGIILVLGLSWSGFSPIQLAVLGLLFGVTWYRPSIGSVLLLLIFSIDSVQPLLGTIQVALSELELVACLLGWLSSPRRGAIDWRPLLWGMPFAAVVLFSGLANIEWYKVPPHVVRSSEIFLASFLASNCMRGKSAKDILKWALPSAAVFYGVAGFLQFEQAHAGRVFSFFSNPNQFAGYLGLLFPFFLMLFFRGAEKPQRLLWGYLALFCLAAQMAAASRSALGASLIAGGLLWIVHYRKMIPSFLKAPRLHFQRFRYRSGRLVVMHAVVVLLAFSALWLHTPSRTRLESRLQRFDWSSPVGLGNGLRRRQIFWAVGVQVWKDHPFWGVGPGRWKASVEDYWDLFDARFLEEQELRKPGRRLDSAPWWMRESLQASAHNLWIQLAASFGILGPPAFLFWLILVLRAMISQPPSNGTEGDVWRMAGLGLIVAFLIHNALDTTFPSLALETGFLVGVAVAFQVGEGRDGGIGSAPKPEADSQQALGQPPPPAGASAG